MKQLPKSILILGSELYVNSGIKGLKVCRVENSALSLSSMNNSTNMHVDGQTRIHIKKMKYELTRMNAETTLTLHIMATKIGISL